MPNHWQDHTKEPEGMSQVKLQETELHVHLSVAPLLTSEANRGALRLSLWTSLRPSTCQSL